MIPPPAGPGLHPAQLIGALVLLAGCGYFPSGSGDDDSATGTGFAPVIDSSAPSAGILVLPSQGTLEFSALGEDPDSLQLQWSWSLDEEQQAFGFSEDGAFDTGWTLPWTEDLAGTSVDVHFSVSDGGGLTTTLQWPVDVAS